MNKLPTKNEMQKLLDVEIQKMDAGLKEYVVSKLIPLQLKTLKWEYGNNEEFPAWVFADFKERNVGAAYCQGGHGSSGDTWGLIIFNNDYFSMDAGWYSSLEDLFKDGWYKYLGSNI